jgi:microcystin-dependent protein
VSDPFVAEIRIFAGNFAPKGWASCDGQLLPISQNTALFSLLGTMYGGDGKSTFALPNMAGNAPMFWGQGSGLSLYDEGQESGSQTVTLLESEMPAHSHTLQGSAVAADQPIPTGLLTGTPSADTPYCPPAGAPLTSMALQALPPAGGSLPHNNMMPTLTLYFIIALQGVFPPRG